MLEYRSISNRELAHKLGQAYGIRFRFLNESKDSPAMYVSNPSKGEVVISKRALDYNETRFKKMLLHEAGHILDYRERGPIKFYWDAITSFPKKISLKKSNISPINRVKQYHALPLEARANEIFNLQF